MEPVQLVAAEDHEGHALRRGDPGRLEIRPRLGELLRHGVHSGFRHHLNFRRGDDGRRLHDAAARRDDWTVVVCVDFLPEAASRCPSCGVGISGGVVLRGIPTRRRGGFFGRVFHQRRLRQMEG